MTLEDVANRAAAAQAAINDLGAGPPDVHCSCLDRAHAAAVDAEARLSDEIDYLRAALRYTAIQAGLCRACWGRWDWQHGEPEKHQASALDGTKRCPAEGVPA